MRLMLARRLVKFVVLLCALSACSASDPAATPAPPTTAAETTVATAPAPTQAPPQPTPPPTEPVASRTNRDRVLQQLGVAAFAPFNVDGQEEVGPWLFGSDEESQQAGFECYQAELESLIDVAAIVARVGPEQTYIDLAPAESMSARQAVANCLAAADYRSTWITIHVWAWNTYARNRNTQPELLATNPCFAPVFDSPEEFVAVLVSDIHFADQGGGSSFVGLFDCTASTSPPSAPTPAPTPPSDPWYRCEVADYAIVGVNYRVVNIAIDDPDGGLVAHLAPGIDATVTEVLPDRSDGLQVIGCQENSNSNNVWWLIDGRGWVNATYLQAYVPNGSENWQPGLTDPIDSEQFAALIGLEAPDLETMASLIGETLAFPDHIIVEVREFVGVDAQGGIAGYDIGGLRDDSVAGYRLELGVTFIKDDAATDILGFRVSQLTARAVCSRGVNGARCV